MCYNKWLFGCQCRNKKLNKIMFIDEVFNTEMVNKMPGILQ